VPASVVGSVFRQASGDGRHRGERGVKIRHDNHQPPWEEAVKRTEFEAITLERVQKRAGAEPPSEEETPKNFERPWSQLLDEMTAADASAIGDLPEQRVTAFFRSTGAGMEG
jgi:hypothetical protein